MDHFPACFAPLGRVASSLGASDQLNSDFASEAHGGVGFEGEKVEKGVVFGDVGQIVRAPKGSGVASYEGDSVS